MKIRDWAEYHSKTIDPTIVFAGEFLEARGMTFMVDFGTHDAVDKAANAVIEYLEYIDPKKNNDNWWS